MNMNTATSSCPCGSAKVLDACCLPLIQKKEKAKTAESLLRARYTAFTRGDTSFILETHHSKTKKDVNKKDIEEWSKNSKWIALEVIKTDQGAPSDEKGTIIFHAKYRGSDDKMVDHWEQSVFEKENGEWKFLDAQGVKPAPIQRVEPKTGRNDPCPCGSGKKFKKCCDQKSA